MPAKRKKIKATVHHEPQIHISEHIVPFIVFVTSFAMAMLFTSQMTSAMANIITGFSNQLSIGSSGPNNNIVIETAVDTNVITGTNTSNQVYIPLSKPNVLTYQVFVSTTTASSSANNFIGGLTDIGTYGCVNQMYPSFSPGYSYVHVRCISTGPSDPIPAPGNTVLVRYYYAAGPPLYCGDGVRTGNEVCDNGGNNGKPGYCNASCSGQIAALPVCGNGVRESGEACDDGVNNGQSGFCNTTCTGTVAPAVCGNGTLEQNELCDDGSQNGRVGYCNSLCNAYMICPANFSAGTVNNERGCLSNWRQTSELTCAVQCTATANQYPNKYYSCKQISAGSYGCFGYPIESSNPNPATSTTSTAKKQIQ